MREDSWDFAFVLRQFTMGSGEEETKIIYHIGDEDTPYLIKLSIPAKDVTLKDFKDALQKPSHKYFFKSMDDDFG